MLLPFILAVSAAALVSANLTVRANDALTENWLDTPVDHFPDDAKYAPHSSSTFKLRYFFSDRFYDAAAKGPIIFFDPGEDSADRFTTRFLLEESFLVLLGRQTKAIIAIVEHRYYGKSFPTADLSTDSLRFLDIAQSMADNAFWSQNVVFPGYEHLDLTSRGTRHIYMGGSYSGAKAMFARKTYPDVFFGAVASSPTAQAMTDYWEFYEAVIKYGDQTCVRKMQATIHIIDLLIDKADQAAIDALKQGYGLGGVIHTQDWLQSINGGMDAWLSQTWTPSTNNNAYEDLCGNLTLSAARQNFSSEQVASIAQLVERSGFLSSSYHQSETSAELATNILNHMQLVRPSTTSWSGSCATQDACYSTFEPKYWQSTDLAEWSWRTFRWQWCSQFGFVQPGSSYPAGKLPVVSRHLDLPFLYTICRNTYPPGKYHSLPATPDVMSYLKYGGWTVSTHRLAIVCGEVDPWRQAGPCADAAPSRQSTVSQPFVIMPGISHKGFYYGTQPSDVGVVKPKAIADAQVTVIAAVQAWLASPA
ncbi:uncharacterized protein L969DRAFT_59910 [Mixia osmundae IAM 14324]|uniref:Uncharacterized protein n=1 Tax=Mixia osmundae (strain CBS 9802 / IAM 14324 / JCM 22182 / KY 12970) TaxID=764103 RepID=G7EAP9_MIXOS|nr:uncharacterized protein L969DRAFT_59910 [Mixia osmundae IAM 14324]KEI40878.1 hypothetical protein L969DRAFT_59910 [Mixia osmundae IAM 14324]GAA99909.1 hypothetical protein E5Q_06612 [Mixia osmundae IAM 14324]